jgi:23S rRNA (cytidine1920-2'-O)/16S rRNA (cytidine1409-2'-O)-methyltransferase
VSAPAKPKKTRLDQVLAGRELAADSKEAAAMIMAGLVFSGARRMDKPGKLVAADLELSVRGKGHPYVSRGGLKLEAALKRWKLDLGGLRCIDLGSSTGGFSDCMLQCGAAEVTAVDSGTNQLDWRLRKDPRVRSMENTNARSLQAQALGGAFDFASLDLSFISLSKIFPVLKNLLKPGAPWVALVKPQFEAAKSEVPAGGVITDMALRQRIVEGLRDEALAQGLGPEAVMESPIQGRDGNVEFLLMGRRA